MAYLGETTLNHPKLSSFVDVRVTVGNNAPQDQAMFGYVATLVLNTGACYVQTYATKAALTEYAEMLLAAAEALAQAEREQIAEAA